MSDIPATTTEIIIADGNVLDDVDDVLEDEPAIFVYLCTNQNDDNRQANVVVAFVFCYAGKPRRSFFWERYDELRSCFSSGKREREGCGGGRWKKKEGRSHVEERMRKLPTNAACSHACLPSVRPSGQLRSPAPLTDDGRMEELSCCQPLCG